MRISQSDEKKNLRQERGSAPHCSVTRPTCAPPRSVSPPPPPPLSPHLQSPYITNPPFQWLFRASRRWPCRSSSHRWLDKS